MNNTKPQTNFYSIPFTYTFEDTLFVECDSLEEAISIAERDFPEIEKDIVSTNEGNLHYKNKSIKIDIDKLKQKYPNGTDSI